MPERLDRVASRQRLLLAVLLVVLVVGGLIAWLIRSGRRIAPPPPRATATWVDTLPPIPTSYIDVPVRYNLAPALRWLESAVPTVIGDLEHRHQAPGNSRVHYAFRATRKPFQLTIKGRGATLVAEVAYRVRVWYNLPSLLPEISASCGVDGEAPRARFVVHTSVTLKDNWRLQPHTRTWAKPLTDKDRDQCKVTMFEINVTDNVLGAARKALQKELAKLDRRIARFDLPSGAQRIWTVLASPLQLTDSLWLLVNPDSVRIGLLRVHHDTLVTAVGLSAHPRVIGGAKPVAVIPPLPEPQDTIYGPPALHLLAEARVPYGAASAVLTDQLRGTTIRVADRRLRVDSVRVTGVGGGRVAVGLGVSGPVDGVLYFVGRPVFDTATASISMPDLTYDLSTRNLLVGRLAWLAGPAITDFLRSHVHIALAPVLEQGRALLEKNLNRELADGVRLRATVSASRALSVQAAPHEFLARGIATGHGELILDWQPEKSAAASPQAPPTGEGPVNHGR
ncbi:MAG TPA: DUF4403 family protein [Gemmatimonadales bacterium]|nr:DUF4403 family protein [Gemmatimonadales bacterium]